MLGFQKAGNPTYGLRTHGNGSMVTEDMISLAEALIAQRLIPAKAIEDSLHIAIATLHHVDLLVLNGGWRNEPSICWRPRNPSRR
jgi:hypothetical protein